MYMWTGPVLVKDPPPVNETSTCEWNEMSTCEWIFDKRLKFHRWFLHVLTRHKENYTCRLKIVRLSAVRLTVMVFSFWQDYIKWDFARCAQWRLRSAWASAQSDQSLRRPHKYIPWVLSYPFSTQRRPDQTGHWADPPSLIWVFAGCSEHFVCFVMLRHIYIEIPIT